LNEEIIPIIKNIQPNVNKLGAILYIL